MNNERMSNAQIPQHTVRHTTRDGVDVAIVEVRRTYPGEVADVWEAFTNPERLPRWFLPVTGDLRPGGQYQLEGNAGGSVTHCDPPHAFSVTWELMGFVSWVTVDLTTAGPDRTTVTLAHTVDTDSDHWRQFGPAAVGIGWDLAWVRGLQPFLRGNVPDSQAEQMWPLTSEGTAFVRACADSWAEAEIAGGGGAALPRGLGVATARDLRLCPGVRAGAYECRAFGRQRPHLLGLRVRDVAAQERLQSADPGQVPADAHRSGAELAPVVAVRVHGVRQGHGGSVGPSGGQVHCDPADEAHQLPGDGEGVRRVAVGDAAAGVAFQLVLPAGPEVAGDRQEPAREAFWVGEGLPHVGDLTGIGAAHLDDGDVHAVPGGVPDCVLRDLRGAHALIVHL